MCNKCLSHIITCWKCVKRKSVKGLQYNDLYRYLILIFIYYTIYIPSLLFYFISSEKNKGDQENFIWYIKGPWCTFGKCVIRSIKVFKINDLKIEFNACNKDDITHKECIKSSKFKKTYSKKSVISPEKFSIYKCFATYFALCKKCVISICWCN